MAFVLVMEGWETNIKDPNFVLRGDGISQKVQHDQAGALAVRQSLEKCLIRILLVELTHNRPGFSRHSPSSLIAIAIDIVPRRCAAFIAHPNKNS